MSLPPANVAPARTRATRCGALTIRQRRCADSMSLNAMARPAARDPWPLVTFVRSLTVAKVDSIVILSSRMDHGCGLGGCVVDGVAGASARRVRAGAQRGLMVIEERRDAEVRRGW